MILSVPKDEISSTIAMAHYLLSNPIRVRALTIYIRLVNSHSNAFPDPPLHYKGLQYNLIKAIIMD